MLCQFTVKNYRCLKEEVTLDLQAADISEHENSVLTDIDDEKFLPLSVIYGPNGSGKSTVLHAIYSLACKIMRPICAASYEDDDCEKQLGDSGIKPYLFSKDAVNQPTEFEVFFRTEKYEYQYNTTILKDKVIKEELHRKLLTGIRSTMVFSRNGSKIILKGSLKSYDCSGISNNLSLLSFFGITHRRNAIIKDVIGWFENKFTFVDYGNPGREASVFVAKKEKMKSKVLAMLKELDIDIVNYRTKKEDDELQVYTAHKVDEKIYELNLWEESDGSIKIFGLLPYIADCLTVGGTFIADELDSKLHPLLLKYIISLFNNPEINKNKAQFIFTSHDISTMNSECFRKDEIWFVAKGENQSSKLYSLVEFQSDGFDSKDESGNYGKNYLEGKYGADPYFQRIINWEE